MNPATDRPRGVLSPADREFLRGERSFGHAQSERNAAMRVRDRVEHGIRDFGTLVHHLPARDRRRVFETVDDPAFVDACAAMLGFAYAGLTEQGVDFEHVLAPAVRKAEEVHAANALGSAVDVEVTFEVETDVRTELDDVLARIDADDPVAPEDLFSLVVRDADALDDYDDVVVERGPDDDEFVARLAAFLDADTTDLPLDRVRLDL